MEINDLISIGFVKNAVGNSGVLSIIPDKNFGRVFPHLSELFVVLPDNTVRLENIQSCKIHHNRIHLKLKSISNKSEAFSLKNAKLMVADEDIETLKKEGITDFYKLDGYKVLLKNKKEIGTVYSVFETAAHEILVVKKSRNSREILIPNCDEFINENR